MFENRSLLVTALRVILLRVRIDIRRRQLHDHIVKFEWLFWDGRLLRLVLMGDQNCELKAVFDQFEVAVVCHVIRFD